MLHVDELSEIELAIHYEGLVHVLYNSKTLGRYFHNNDPRHAVYRSGAHGGPPFDYADSPTKNPLFVLGHAAHLALVGRGIDVEQYAPRRRGAPFATWEAFCRVVERHEPVKRRRSRKTKTPVGRLLGAAVLIGVMGSAARAQWSVVNLHPVGASESGAYGVQGGQQVGYVRFGCVAHASLWSGTAASWVDLHSTQFTYSVASSAHGGQQAGAVVLGGSCGMGGPTHACRWTGSGSSWVDINPAGSSDSVVYGAENGQQVGYAYVGGVRRASLWSGTASSWVDLHPAGARQSWAFDVGGGQQVGFAAVGVDEFSHASLWTGTAAASWVDLNPAGAYLSVAYGVDDGQQVGEAHFSDCVCASLWSGSAASWVNLHPGGETSSRALGVYRGHQVGLVEAFGSTRRASFWSGTAASLVDLHAFLSSDFTMSEASGIWNDGNLEYVVGNGYNAITGRTEALMWVRPLVPCGSVSFASHPSDVVPLPGHTVSLSVTLNGTPTSFRWRHNTTPLSDGSRISGSATATLTIGSVQPSDEGVYDCIVSSVCNTVTSNPATLSCDPILLTQPPPRSPLRPGLQLSVGVPLAAPYSYRWRQNGQNLFNIPGLFSGVTTRTLTLLAVDASLAGSYDCVVTDACGTATSAAAGVFCPADFDDGTGTGTPDGGTTIDDLLYYLYIFDAGLLASDIDDGSGMGIMDGGVTIDDLLYYLARFDAGC